MKVTDDMITIAQESEQRWLKQNPGTWSRTPDSQFRRMMEAALASVPDIDFVRSVVKKMGCIYDIDSGKQCIHRDEVLKLLEPIPEKRMCIHCHRPEGAPAHHNDYCQDAKFEAAS